MRNIWFERSIPSQYEPMLDGVAVAIGAGDHAEEEPFYRIAEADGVIAGGRTYDGVMMDQAPRLLVITRVGIGYD